MQRFVLLIAVVGCATESPSDHFKSLAARVTVHCGTLTRDCTPVTSPNAAAACLNNALAGNKVADAFWTLTDESDDTIIVADRKVYWFSSSFNKLEGTSSLSELPACAGPVVAHPEATCPAAQLGCE